MTTEIELEGQLIEFEDSSEYNTFLQTVAEGLNYGVVYLEVKAKLDC
jgi:hypothetical protein